jgi:sterol desaturase/sphingolipid hydroxylase (fatty acid hydroxylase superfamily)
MVVLGHLLVALPGHRRLASHRQSRTPGVIGLERVTRARGSLTALLARLRICAVSRVMKVTRARQTRSGRDPQQHETGVITSHCGIWVKDWSAPAAGEAKLMDSPWLEPLTRTHPITPVAVFGPVLALLLWRQIDRDQPSWALVAFAMAGVVLWTVMEYALHRFVFHCRPRRRLGIVLTYLVHGVHHAYPSDRGRLVMPPTVSLPFAVAFYALFVGAAGVRVGEGLYTGFLTGYVAYDTLHYVVHATRARTPWLAALQRNHMSHHFRVPDRRFGVSTTVWDHVFGTR